MAAPPTARTFQANETETAAFLNSVSTAVNFALNPPRCFCYVNVAANLTTGTYTLLSFDSEVYDTDTMHSTVTNTSRIVANTAGLYWVEVGIGVAANATNDRFIQIRKNAAGNQASGTLIKEFRTATTANAFSDARSLDVQMAAGDYLEAWAWQGSGGTLALQLGSTSTFVQARWVASS